METLTSITDKLTTLAKSGQDLLTGNSHYNKSRHNPIEILKRLQREAFSDLMKLRDRQDKVEKLLTYKTSKGSPFDEGGTHVRGEIDVSGVFLRDYDRPENVDAIRRAGLRTGINARITFESKLRETDTLEAEFLSGQRNHHDSGDVIGGALSLAKVSYTARMTDWLSMVAIPLGARCRDVAISTDCSLQEKSLTEYPSLAPPLLNQINGSAIGVTVKKSNIVASLAQFVVDLPDSFGRCFSTFGHIVYQLPHSSKLSLFGLHPVPKPRHQSSFIAMTIPPAFWRGLLPRETFTQSSSLGPDTDKNIAAGSLALMLESELDESTRIRGWVQMRNSNPSHLQWSVSMSDFPEDETGWGISLGGTIQGPKSWDHFQVETFLKFNFGNRVSVQPAFVYLMDGNNQLPALMFRSTWSL